MSMLQPPPSPGGTIQLSRPLPGMTAECGESLEDGCTVARPPLRASDPAVWFVITLVAAATAWLLGGH